jgi:hypothetical protein
MTTLNDIYGYCIVPKNTILYRGHEDKSFKDCMFFATSHSGAGVWNDTIQIWKTTTDITVLFVVEYLTTVGIAISALPRLFNSIFPLESNPTFTDLDIKHWDLIRRDKLVRKLFDDYKISGWLTSFENNTFNEVCLFDKQANSKQIKLIETSNRKDDKYFKDSLKRIKIFPSQTFYEQTKKELNKHSTFIIDDTNSFKKHKRYISANIKYYLEQGMTLNEARHEMYDLRLNLKV